ncbi:hypothetical protein AN396_02165 [Candidatus Epulonipiscium fishelsonii]|uniref:Uncharacterized protein n=1 Tax=Candidatus Epulonipiscium fishelsonii TaxID=77094 RepID=A0ACC8XFL7_9FIRM|nr:hypothetical protein AN396_02165 [Epulopiscium sp. SCG-B11WGA-EpuloA1]
MAKLHDVKQQNKQDIIKLLFLEKILSKKRIALTLGLSFASLTNLCRELLEEGLIIEKEAIISKKAGRREIALEINKNFKRIIGVTINPEVTTIIVSDLSFTILKKVVMRTQPLGEPHFDSIINVIHKISSNLLLSSLNTLGICISIYGNTDGIYAYNGIWSVPTNVIEYLSSKLNLPVVMDNNTRCNAMLEQIYSTNADFIFIKYIEAGISGAVVSNGVILYGQDNNIADIGHTIVNISGEYCDICKRKGCLEKTISMETILSFAKEHFHSDPIIMSLCNNDSDNITMNKIIEAVELGSIIE